MLDARAMLGSAIERHRLRGSTLRDLAKKYGGNHSTLANARDEGVSPTGAVADQREIRDVAQSISRWTARAS